MMTNAVQVCRRCRRSILTDRRIRILPGKIVCADCVQDIQGFTAEESVQLIMQQPDAVRRFQFASALLIVVGALGVLLHTITAIGGKPVYFHLPSLPLSILLLAAGCTYLLIARQWRRDRQRQIAQRVSRPAATPFVPCSTAAGRWRSL